MKPITLNSLYKVICLFALLSIYSLSYSQVSDFDVLGTVCRNESLEIENNSSDFSRVEWDFCQDGLRHANAASLIDTTDISLPFGVEMAYDQGNWFGFVGSLSNHSIYRLTFGSDPNAVPQASQIASFGGGQIKIISEDNNWYAIGLGGNGSFTRISFGDSLDGTPVVEDLTNLGWSGTTWGIDVVKDNGNYVAIIADYGSSVLHFVNFGNSITNAVSSASVTTIATGNANLSGPVRVELIDDNGNWFGIVNSLNNGNVLLLDFGTTLISEPSIEILTNVSNPAGLAFIKDGLDYFALVSAAAGRLVRLEFGRQVNETPAIVDVTGLGELEISYAFSIVKIATNWSVYLMGFYNQLLFKIDFTDQCTDVSAPSSVALEPESIKYATSGEKYVELAAYDSDGNVAISSQQFTVTTSEPPAVEVDYDGNCIESPVNFLAVSGEAISTFDWDFGDLTTHATTASASHQYQYTGTYQVKLTVASSNGCSNRIGAQLKIYPVPDPAFVFNDGQLCTNSEVSFINQTEDIYEGLLTYEWFVNGQPVASSRDTEYIFESPGVFDVTLKTSIPGCADEIAKPTPDIKVGPTIAFAFDSHCETDPIQFTSTISEPVTEYQWTFGDGETSYLANPVHEFSASGEYEVSLMALSQSGCNTKKNEHITIHDKPVPQFEIVSQEPYCTEIPVILRDLIPSVSDGEIESVKWIFNDGSDTLAASAGDFIEHGFESDGAYEITLLATSTWGCRDTTYQTLNISPSPEVDFSSTQACVGFPVDFSGTGSEGITSWEWQIGDKNYSADEFTHTFRTPGTHTVELVVSALNGCERELSKSIRIPIPLDADFSITKNCIKENAFFTDITMGEDSVVSWQWNVNEGQAILEGNPATFVFTDTLTQSVTMTITAESGCSYIKTKSFEVAQFPEAAFSVSSEIGSPPFPVDFTNRSKHATRFSWDFKDGQFSTEVSPQYIFTEIGEYNVSLVASNEEGCESVASKLIKISPPFPDVSIIAITTSENPDGTTRVMVTLQNDGNTILYDLPVMIDMSGNLDLTETVTGPVLPRSRVNLVLSYGLKVTDDFKFLCASAELENDRVPNSNRNCIEFQNDLSFLPGYPNPVKDFLGVEWIASDEQLIKVSLVNTLGFVVWSYNFSSQRGLNKKIFPVESLQKGVYMLVLEAKGIKTTQRLLLTR